jgi:hypothetical protein
MDSTEKSPIEPSPSDSAGHSYSYKPSLMGGPWEFHLTPDAIEWQAGRRSGRIHYRDIRRTRLSFRPVTMQTYRFLAEIWPAEGPKITIASSSWKSMFEQERLDAAYAVFITELHQRVAAANPPARFETGSPPLIYWPGFALFAMVSSALAALIVRGLKVEAWEGTAFIAAFLAVFLWQAGTFFRRNRPGVYSPGQLPENVLPSR